MWQALPAAHPNLLSFGAVSGFAKNATLWDPWCFRSSLGVDYVYYSYNYSWEKNILSWDVEAYIDMSSQRKCIKEVWISSEYLKDDFGLDTQIAQASRWPISGVTIDHRFVFFPPASTWHAPREDESAGGTGGRSGAWHSFVGKMNPFFWFFWAAARKGKQVDRVDLQTALMLFHVGFVNSE